jgi:hypothetical protein
VFGFFPKIAVPKFWLANILVELFLVQSCPTFAENKLVVEHWHAKILATIQTITNVLVNKPILAPPSHK